MLVMAVAVQADELNREACLRMAHETNRNGKISSLRKLMADDNLKAYKTNYLPKFSVTGNYIYSNAKPSLFIDGGYLPTFTPNPTTGALEPNIIGYGPDGSPVFGSYALMPELNFDVRIESVFSGGARVEQPIYMGGKIDASVRMAGQAVKIASYDIVKSEKEIIEKTDEAYWNLLKVEELLKSAATYRNVVAEFSRQMENAYSAGMKNQNELQKVRVRVNEAELLYRRAENGVKLAKMNLCYIIGIPLNTTSVNVLDTNSPEEDIDDMHADITNRPEYGMLLHQVELKKQNVRLVRSDFMPQLAAMASYNYTNGIKLVDSKLFNNATFYGGVNLNIPVFNWGEGRKKISAARTEVLIAQTQLAEVSDLMQLELMRALNEYDEASLEVKLTTTALDQAEINLKMSRDQYEVGMETLADYLEAQSIWQKAMSDLINARAKRRITYTAYMKAAGLL